MRWLLCVLVTLVLVAGCARPAGVTFTLADSAAGGVAWEHLAMVERLLPDRAAGAAVTDQEELDAAWQQHRFDGVPPSVDFAHEVVLLLAQADDACPDELVGLEVVGGRLEVDWLEPPGGCILPLIMRLHAVRVHRGHLQERFTVALPEPFADEVEPVTIELPAYDGEAPPPPEAPRAMTGEELDAVFAGQPVRRCTGEGLGRGGEVDGPLSEDPEVAQAQRSRAEFGVASDEATVRRVMGSPDLDPEWGVPLLAEEVQHDIDVSNLVSAAATWLREQGLDTDREVTPMVDRSDGISAAVVVWEGDADRVRALLDGEFGPSVVTVVPNPYEPQALQQAQLDVHRADLPREGPGSITHTQAFPGPLQVGIIDPSREHLDAIAAVIDPDLVCVDPVLGGVRQLGG